MTLSIITPEWTTNHEHVLDITIPTANGAKHIDQHSGSVELLQTGKATIFIQHDDTEPQKVEIYIQDGILYIEKRTINLVTAAATRY